MAPSTSTVSRRFPLWAWLVLGGAVLAVGAVVLGPGEPPAPPVVPEPPSTQPAEDPGPPGLADPGEIPEQPWAAELLTVELRSLGGVAEERITPKRAGSMEGAVLNEAREGIEGVRISVLGGPQDGWSTVSREGGHYLFPELLPGTHFFRLEIPGYGETVRSHRVRREARSWRDFRVSPPVSVDLLLRNHENDPLAGARVISGLAGPEVLSDEEGLARVGPLVGGERVLLTIRAEGHVPVRQELNLLLRPAGAPPVEVPALPRGGRVYGRVRSWPGGPFPQITVVPRGSQIGTHKVAWETWQGVQVENDGSFELVDLPTTHLVDIRVFHPSGVAEPRLRSIRPAQHTPTSVDFVVKRGLGRVAGRVLDDQGQAVRGAELVLEASDPEAMLGELYPGLERVPSTSMLPVPAPLRRTLRSAADGSFDFAVGDHPEGTGSLVLTVRAPGFVARRTPIRRSYTDLELRLERVDLRNSLRLDAGSRSHLPRVEWYLDGRPIRESATLTLTPDQAAETLGGLPAGLYDVLVRAGNEVVRHEREFRVEGATRFAL